MTNPIQLRQWHPGTKLAAPMPMRFSSQCASASRADFTRAKSSHAKRVKFTHPTSNSSNEIPTQTAVFTFCVTVTRFRLMEDCFDRQAGTKNPGVWLFESRLKKPPGEGTGPSIHAICDGML